MSDPNEPRVMDTWRNRKATFDDTTGNAGRDGFTRLARAEMKKNDDPFSFAPGGITPRVGKRSDRGPRFTEDC
jgi:hypothetical protein